MSLDGTEPDKTQTQYLLFTQAINIVGGAVSHGNECNNLGLKTLLFITAHFLC